MSFFMRGSLVDLEIWASNPGQFRDNRVEYFEIIGGLENMQHSRIKMKHHVSCQELSLIEKTESTFVRQLEDGNLLIGGFDFFVRRLGMEVSLEESGWA